jgi:hypothetical protein
MKKHFYIVLAVYVAVIACSVIYFGLLQHFGFSGMEFRLGGHNQMIDIMDIVILVATTASLFLLIISLLATKRTGDTRMLIISIAFFFFVIKEFLFIFENFFPGENIYIDNAERTLELLILLSFIMLIYGTYKRTENKSRIKKRK